MAETDLENILEQLPYAPPFLFVDGLTHLDATRVEGHYTFRPESAFYRGHFKGNPVTPGVLLTECCAQIGLACLGLHLLGEASGSRPGNGAIALGSAEMEFLRPVFPGERVRVVGEPVYFRFGKLKARVELYNGSGHLACRGTLSGMIKKEKV